MTVIEHFLKAGDWVEVKTPSEISQSLDANGTLDGLPFMQEMVQFCGKQFRVLRQARKICVECVTPRWKSIDMREFVGSAVYVIDGLRCSGQSHDGCQRGCLLFWKAAWLRKLEHRPRVDHLDAASTEVFHASFKSKVGPDKYFCQSTELVRSTSALSFLGRLRICFEELRSSDVAPLQMIKLISLPLAWKVIHRLFFPRHVVGPMTRTHLIQIGLKPGDVVEVKSRREIAQTLNKQGCNRGLRYDRVLNRYCGTLYRVRERLDKMIVESSGHMAQLHGTVTLEGSYCMCHTSALGGCSRQDLVYWREAWLKRATE
jgi:hypothetical protein